MKNNSIMKYRVVVLALLVLAALVCLSSCGGTPKAADANGTIEGTQIKWKYTSSDSALEISGTGEIPNNTSAWAGVIASVKEIEVEEGITGIGNRAFYGAAALEEVKLPESVTSLGERAFAYCSSLEEIKLPAALVSIGDGAFEACTKLSTIKTGEVLTSLGERAFAFCKSLESAHILSPVDIKAETFYNCLALKTLVLHADVTEEMVSADAFKGTEFTYEDSKPAVDPDKKVNVTIKYVYADGTEASASVVKEGLSIGEAYVENSPEIEGYKADKLTVSGTAPEGDVEIVVTYEKHVEETEAESDTEPSDVAEPKDPNYVALIIMVVVLAGVVIGGYFLMKSNKQNAEKAKNQNKAKNRKQK